MSQKLSKWAVLLADPLETMNMQCSDLIKLMRLSRHWITIRVGKWDRMMHMHPLEHGVSIECYSIKA